MKNLEKVQKKGSNTVASILKTLATIGGILGTIIAFFIEDYTLIIALASIMSAIFVYAIGEVITLLQTIVDNTNNNK